MKVFVTTLFLLLVVSHLEGRSAPYPNSSTILDVSFDFSTHKSLCPGSDNWAITWSNDNHQYATWCDAGAGLYPPR